MRSEHARTHDTDTRAHTHTLTHTHTHTHSLSLSLSLSHTHTQVLLRAKIVLPSHTRASSCDLAEFGLVKVNFEIPMYTVSGLQVRDRGCCMVTLVVLRN
jgi:hypothetical protein